MKYKAYITDSDKIFWTKNSVDKPTKDYFLDLMEKVEWKDLGNITPNFINQFNGSITVDKDNYTYLKLINTETNEIKYYSIDSISRIMNNGFVVDITLDVFTTYTLYFYESLKDKPIKVNRTSALCVYWNFINSMVKPDPLISIHYNPGLYKTKKQFYTFGFQNKQIDKTTGYRYKMWNNQTWELLNKYNDTVTFVELYKTNIPGYLYELTVFDVYQDSNGEWFIVPIFGECDTRINNFDGWIYAKINNRTDNFYCWNYEYFTNRVKNNTFWANKYVGRFHIPLWTTIVQQLAIPVLVETVQYTEQQYILMFKLERSLSLGVSISKTYFTVNEFDFTNISINNFSKTSKKINSYLCNKLTQNDNYCVFNFSADFTKNPAPINLERVNVWVEYPYENATNNFSISNTNGLIWYNTNLPIAILLKGVESFPVSTNAYSQYLAGVQSQQNTNLQIAKQQSIFGGIKSAFSGIMGVAGGLLTGNIGGAISSGLGAITGIAGSVMQYQNQKRQIDAQNADALRSATANNINASNIDSNISNSKINRVFNDYNGRINMGEHDGIIANKPFEQLNVEMYNSIIWESGYFVDNYLKLNDLLTLFNVDFFTDYVNKFIYWDFEIPTEYVKFTYPNYNNELVDAITTTIINPVRFWKETPDYNCELIGEISHKIGN